MATPRLGGRVRLLDAHERAEMDPALLDMVEYRKSGLSLNWIVGCPLDCGYCVRHLFGNYGLKVPRALAGDVEAFAALVGHRFFRQHVTPVQLLNRATDPMLPPVKPHLFAMLRMLDDAGLTNHVLVITRWRVTAEDCAALNALRNVRVTLLVTYSGIDDNRIEPVDSTVAADSLRLAHAHADRFRVVLYWRPLVPGLNDTDTHLATAMELSRHAHATVFTGLFFRDEIRDYYRAHGLPEPYEQTARRKLFPEHLERRVLDAAASRQPGGSALFRKTSCAVSHAHGLADYNGHVGVRELCDICPDPQLDRCRRAVTDLSEATVAARVRQLGGDMVDLTARAVTVAGLDEQHRYLLQHTLGVQVHDRAKPHHHRRHGRADLGWTATGPTSVPGPMARAAAGPDVDREEVTTTCRSCRC